MRVRWIMLGFWALATLGCGQVKTIHYLRGVDFDPEMARGLPLDQVYNTTLMAKLKGGKVLVKVEDARKTIDRSVSKINPKLDEDNWWDNWRDDFELYLTATLRQSGLFADVQRSKYALDSFKPDAVLDVAVTEWHEGNRWFRAYLGFGFGATRVQWEGTLTDTKTKQVIFAFADARVHPGGPSFMGIPFKVWRGPALIAEDLRFGSKDLTKTMSILFETPPEETMPAVPLGTR